MMEHRTQYSQKLNVWAGIIGDNIMGPLFINGTLTSEKYYTLLRSQVIPQLALLYPNRNGEIGMSTYGFNKMGQFPIIHKMYGST